MANSNIDRTIRILEEKIDYTFSDKDLLITSLTHTSFINEQAMISTNNSEDYYLGHNERLEFLGDAVLEIIITDELFFRYPQEREGYLTNKRTSLVNEERLVEMAKKLDLPTHIRLGKGEEAQGGRKRDCIIGDAFEALLAAIYLDAKKAKLANPLKPVHKLIAKLYEEMWEIPTKINRKKDSKTLLQELTQALYKKTPQYTHVSATGPGHKLIFCVELLLPNNVKIKQTGQSKRDAEQNAAAEGLALLVKKK